jgi:hypothetical protein
VASDFADQGVNSIVSLCVNKQFIRFTYMLIDHKSSKSSGGGSRNVSKATGFWLADTVSLLRSLE